MPIDIDEYSARHLDALTMDNCMTFSHQSIVPPQAFIAPVEEKLRGNQP
jgi:hypothetical protein